MLARKYDNYAWEAAPAEQEEQQPARRQRKVRQRDPRQVFRRELAIFLTAVLGIYFVNVVRSESLVQNGNILVGLQKQESQLITKNNELKIEVEQLKGPERIIGLAEQHLGMSVARSNIYVKAAATKK